MNCPHLSDRYAIIPVRKMGAVQTCETAYIFKYGFSVIGMLRIPLCLAPLLCGGYQKRNLFDRSRFLLMRIFCRTVIKGTPGCRKPSFLPQPGARSFCQVFFRRSAKNRSAFSFIPMPPHGRSRASGRCVPGRKRSGSEFACLRKARSGAAWHSGASVHHNIQRIRRI